MKDCDYLHNKAAEIRRLILQAIVAGGKGHIGGAFSCVDILTCLYHGGFLRFDPENPNWEERDRFILSKGHSGIALFAILASLNYFDLAELLTFCRDGSRLGGHPDRKVPGIEADTGSLGHGLGIGTGLALSAKLSNADFRTFVMLGDGECYEGSVWEAFLFAGHHGLNNLVAIIDRNQQCVLDFTENCVRLEPLENKIRSFGWETQVVNGHSHEDLQGVFSGLKDYSSAKPLAIIAETVKGKGVSFMEGQIKWHHGVPAGSELEIARRELSAQAEVVK